MNLTQNSSRALVSRFETFDSNDLSLCKDPHEHTFFSPMELEKLEEFKPDFSQQETKDLVKEYLGEWFIPKKTKNPWSSEVSIDKAEELCQAIDVAFSDVPYKREQDEPWTCLSDLKTWEKNAFEIPGFDGNKCWINEWRSMPADIWAATDKPHMLASMRHHYQHNDDILFVSEIEVIVALMIVRLLNGSLPGHNIVPVMIFSFTGDKRGRILQAQMNETSLVIRKSDFYDFSPSIDSHLNVFLQYMMSELQGVTRVVNRPEIKSSVCEETYTIEYLEAWERNKIS